MRPRDLDTSSRQNDQIYQTYEQAEKFSTKTDGRTDVTYMHVHTELNGIAA